MTALMAGISKNLSSAESLLSAYANGIRHFVECDLDRCSLENVNLSGATFLKCFMSFNFRGANLTDVRFEECNLKTATFSKANLTNVIITKCSVEGIDFQGANIKNLKFYNNYYMGSVLQQNDLAGFC